MNTQSNLNLINVAGFTFSVANLSLPENIGSICRRIFSKKGEGDEVFGFLEAMEPWSWREQGFKVLGRYLTESGASRFEGLDDVVTANDEVGVEDKQTIARLDALSKVLWQETVPGLPYELWMALMGGQDRTLTLATMATVYGLALVPEGTEGNLLTLPEIKEVPADSIGDEADDDEDGSDFDSSDLDADSDDEDEIAPAGNSQDTAYRHQVAEA